jgi:DNA uptake protein ComE-like DNA-binding protein
MKNIKSHVTFTKKQRYGIFLLLLLIIAIQCIHYFVAYSSDKPVYDVSEIAAFQREIDSLKLIKIEDLKPKIYPFNPNYITDFKGYALGMSEAEIDRLHAFRAEDKWVNSAQEFQKVTLVSDSLLQLIAPYFKFPAWVSKPKNTYQEQKRYNNGPKTYEEKIDLNKATASQLQSVYGVGEKLSAKIIEYRNRLDGGFASEVELQEVYGLKPDVIKNIKDKFTVKTPRPIVKVNLNTATRDQLVAIKYIDYEIAYNIIESRTLREGFSSLDDLTKVKGFPLNKIEIIKLYLMLE